MRFFSTIIASALLLAGSTFAATCTCSDSVQALECCLESGENGGNVNLNGNTCSGDINTGTYESCCTSGASCS